MQSTDDWSISICRRFAASFGQLRKTTTRCRQSSWESSIATRYEGRVWTQRRKVTLHVHREETYSSHSRAEGRRSFVGAAVPGCDGAGWHGARPNRGGSETADRILLYSARRDHGKYVARSVIGQVDAVRFRCHLQAQSDPCVAGAVQEVRVVVREPAECRHGGFGSFVYARHVAERDPSGYRRAARAYGHDSRSGDRENHRAGDASALARSGRGNHRAVGGRWRRILLHAVFPRRGIAVADGAESAEGLSPVVRGGRHAAGARDNQHTHEQPAGSDLGGHQEPEGQPRERGQGRSRRISRERSRSRAPNAEGGGER